MSIRPSKWKRLGYQSDAEYRKACSTTTKIKNRALESTEARLAHRQVLQYLWHKAEHDRPEVTTTKSQIMQDVGLTRPTVQLAIRFLKSEGSIVPIRGIYGGKGVPITFSLRVAKTSQNLGEIAIAEMREDRQRKAAFKYLASKHGGTEALRILDAKKGEL